MISSYINKDNDPLFSLSTRLGYRPRTIPMHNLQSLLRRWTQASKDWKERFVQVAKWRITTSLIGNFNRYSLVWNTSHGVLPKNRDQANFCMDITLLIPNRSWWDYKEHFQLALIGYTINIIMIDKEMTELWHLKVCRVSYSNVSCIRDQRVIKYDYVLQK